MATIPFKFSTGKFPDGALSLLLEEPDNNRSIQIIAGVPLEKLGPIHIYMTDANGTGSMYNVYLDDLWAAIKGMTRKATHSVLCSDCRSKIEEPHDKHH